MDTGTRPVRKVTSCRTESSRSNAEPETTIELDGMEYSLIDIRATGDILLDLTFENTKSLSRLVPASLGSLRSASLSKNTKSSNSRVLYRVRLDTLRRSSKYFQLLLGSGSFSEGSKITATLTSLEARHILPSKAEPHELPRISITDDDDATKVAGREAVFADLLRILHGADVATRLTTPYLMILAIMADRFDCTQTIGRYVKRSKYPWPQTYGSISVTTEETLRQKILISWLLDDQSRLASATKELILRGSLRWGAEGQICKDQQTAWWDLQDGLEAELQYRRARVLSCIHSLQKHFLALYTSRDRQCKQFYDSSVACDSYQLGEMIKFFTNKGLLCLTSPLFADYDDYPDSYHGDIESLVTILRQCPSYQIDQNHARCGLRARIIPALDYIQIMLTSNIGIDRRGWKDDRPGTTWRNRVRLEGETFEFRRSIASDRRLKLDGYLLSNKHAHTLFTATAWDWTPED
ncbi:MAG: hypothetical protein M1818_006603 [Claussenomyces sp. TS43310]|nr:MAG: hypothetical protein M1818_006962 [Claussenomyces sp. TS43310]KAI9735026.1 MAG: hypothetical protein M1818_006603 [Claussenomyces sp. TS43310]